MKKILILILSTFVLCSCEWEAPNEIDLDYPLNQSLSPSLPSLVFPTNNLICTNFNLEFEWSKSTSDLRNSISYTIEIALDELFENVVFRVNTSQTDVTFTLEKGTTYFWRVKAIDNKGYESVYTSPQTFFTEPDAGINSIPHSPTVIAPQAGASVSGSTITLDWNATDSDGDPLLFDVYFGESNPPQLFAENLDVMTLDVQVDANTTYYWRVIAKDDKQGVAISRVWSFETE